MKKFVSWSVLAAVIVGASIVSQSTAVPLPSERPIKWEYAELSQRQTRTSSGFPKKGDSTDPADPLQPPAAEIPVIRWTTGDDEITAKTWEEMAEKLKVPPAPKKGTAASLKMRVFDRLGSDGWELVGPTTGNTTGFGGTGTWMFKRRVP